MNWRFLTTFSQCLPSQVVSFAETIQQWSMQSYTLVILITLFVNISHLQLQCRHCLLKGSTAWKLTPLGVLTSPEIHISRCNICCKKTFFLCGAYYYTFIVELKLENSLGIDRSRSRAPPMLVRKYVDENGSAAILASKRWASVAPEMVYEESVVRRQWSMDMRESTLALKPRADVTRSPKQRYKWPTKTTCVL